MSRSHPLLCEWGSFIQAHLHHDGYPSENILYRYARQGEIQDPPQKDRILCVDIPAHLRRVDVQVNRLDPLQGRCVRIWFCAPLRGDGERYTARQLGKLLNLDKTRFESLLKYGIKRLERLL